MFVWNKSRKQLDFLNFIAADAFSLTVQIVRGRLNPYRRKHACERVGIDLERFCPEKIGPIRLNGLGEEQTLTYYVYVLISGERDNYAAMCLISAVSVRGTDPSAKITILSNAETLALLKRDRHPLLDVADEVLAPTLRGLPVHQSRYLKTTLLQHLGGDFIFLDVDTVLIRPIAHRLTLPHSLQMVLDRTEARPAVGFPRNMIAHYERLGWEWPPRHYYNSGVIFVKASADSARLFEEWHRRWRLSLSAGKYQDQPALNSSIMALQMPVARLPVSYNAMVRVDETFRRGAKVLHFFAEEHNLEPGVEYASLVAAARDGQLLTPKKIRDALCRRWPLVHPTSIRRQLQVGNLNEAWKLCLQRLKASRAARSLV